MRLYKFAVVIALACLIFAELCESRGSRGGSRGSRSKSRSSRSSRKSSGGGSASKRKITKYTPITATSRKTPVIVSQTTRGSRSSRTFRNVLVGYVVYRYAFSSAPVYRRGYPMYGRRSVVIPEERAVRIIETETKMLDNEGNFCLNGSQRETERNVSEGASKNVIQANTTIQYGNEKPKPFDGINQNFTLREQEGVDFIIVSRTQYNATLVQGKNCFVVEDRVKGTVIRLYETNPDGASTVAMNAWLSLLTVLVAFVFGR